MHSVIGRLERHFVTANRWLIGLLLAGVFALVFVNVVLRYLFGTSIAWAEEVARFLMIAGTFLGAGLALREGRLVAIDLAQELLPAPLRVALRWAIALLALVFFALLLVYGSQFVAFGWNKETMATQVSRGIPYLAIPLGTAVFLVHLLLFLRRFVAGDWELAGSSDGGGEALPGRED